MPSSREAAHLLHQASRQLLLSAREARDSQRPAVRSRARAGGCFSPARGSCSHPSVPRRCRTTAHASACQGGCSAGLLPADAAANGYVRPSALEWVHAMNVACSANFQAYLALTQAAATPLPAAHASPHHAVRCSASQAACPSHPRLHRTCWRSQVGPTPSTAPCMRPSQLQQQS